MKFNLNNKYKLHLTHAFNHKLLHKIGKQWVTISLTALFLIGGATTLPTITHASSVTTSQSQPKTTNLDHNITHRATKLHMELANNALTAHKSRSTRFNTQSTRAGRKHNKRHYRKSYRRYGRSASYRRNRARYYRHRTSRKRRYRSHKRHARIRNRRVVRKRQSRRRARKPVKHQKARRLYRRRNKKTASRIYLSINSKTGTPVFNNKAFNKLKTGNTSDYSDDYSDMTPSDTPVVKINGTDNIDNYNFNKIQGLGYDGYIKGWVFSNSLSRNPKRKYRSNDINTFKRALNDNFLKNNFTSDQQNQIKDIENRYDYLSKNENSTHHIYSIKPNLPEGVVGQLSNSFKQHTTDWVNFFRSLYSLKPVTDNSNYDLQAQYGADGCKGLDNIAHGLDGMSAKPSNISSNDWQKGIDATNNSNLFEGEESPKGLAEGYFTDGNDINNGSTGHRAWMIDQGLNQIGIGQNSDYNDLYVITPSDNSYESSDHVPLSYPTFGVFPLQYARDGMWTLYTPVNEDGSNGLSDVNVSIHDDTSNENVPIYGSKTAQNYGWYNTLDYKPDDNMLKNGHQYTITISGDNVPNGTYSYTTKLFNLN